MFWVDKAYTPCELQVYFLFRVTNSNLPCSKIKVSTCRGLSKKKRFQPAVQLMDGAIKMRDSKTPCNKILSPNSLA